MLQFLPSTALAVSTMMMQKTCKQSFELWDVNLPVTITGAKDSPEMWMLLKTLSVCFKVDLCS